ncbi:hypothetical protein AB835_00565 [Candidatus Endobugula sertula]|uniref:YD repeat-containing protein n=1 Tax=Candidatus Endobugula sertula TaxID=62101 RepID=A0A1D2QTW5_9GAMM|nr:hypothetical protein AB835_00565 [Candidatus Endobugula sertula]
MLSFNDKTLFFFCSLSMAVLLPFQTQACSLGIIFPANGTIFKTPEAVVFGQGSATTEEGDQGSVTATLNGTTVLSFSGSFSTATSFFGSRGVSVTLQPGVNIFNARGSVGGCSASVSMVYEPEESPSNNGYSSNNTCHPINISTGNKFFSELQYSGSGASPLILSKAYNSNSTHQYWWFSYLQYLDIHDGLVQAYRHDGQVINFTEESTGTFTAPFQRKERLSFAANKYSLRLADNTVETYNSNGQLVSIWHPSNIIHTISYTNNNTITITRHNEQLTLNLTGDNLTQVTLPDGSNINYSYDNVNTVSRLKSVAYADGSTKSYVYGNAEFPLYITEILDENGNSISSVSYDDQGRAISSEVGGLGSGIERTEIEYHADGTRTVTNSLGKQNTYHFTQFNGEYKMTRVEGHASDNCASANQAYTYDSNGFMASKTNWKGNLTTYVHNARGLETSRTEASGTPQARTITTEWHPTFNLRTKITEPERETVLTYDTNRRLTATEVNPR